MALISHTLTIAINNHHYILTFFIQSSNGEAKLPVGQAGAKIDAAVLAAAGGVEGGRSRPLDVFKDGHGPAAFLCQGPATWTGGLGGEGRGHERLIQKAAAYPWAHPG